MLLNLFGDFVSREHNNASFLFPMHQLKKGHFASREQKYKHKYHYVNGIDL